MLVGNGPGVEYNIHNQFLDCLHEMILRNQ